MTENLTSPHSPAPPLPSPPAPQPPHSPSQKHLQNATKLQAQGIFPGSPLPLFDAGRLSLMVLLHAGLYPDHRLLEIGCGALRSGYWLIHFLNRNCYYGFEPNEAMLHAGLNVILPHSLIIFKNPHFDCNDRFDPGPVAPLLPPTPRPLFDFFLCCSIWSHAAKPQIEIMLDQFLTHSTVAGRFLTSYIPAQGDHDDYQGHTWVGRSHQSDQKGSVRHSLAWIGRACTQRGLTITPLPATYNFSNQTWLLIERIPE